MSNMNAYTPSVSIADVLLVSKDPDMIEQLGQSMQQLALSSEICAEVPSAMVLLNKRKFDAVIVDLQAGSQANAVLGQVRRSPSNRTSVIFAVSGSDAETASAFKAGCNFVMRRPLSPSSIGKSLKVAYGLILRERRRYFRCPVVIPVAICRAGMAEIHGQTVNMSEGGIAIAITAALLPGVKVQVHFTLPGHENELVAGAAICWCKKTSLGLQFTSLPSHVTSELQEWLLCRLEESLPESIADLFRGLESTPH